MKWVSTFSYLPIDYGIRLAEVENQTQRLWFDNNLNGNKIRLRFSNKHSSAPLVLEGANVGIMGKDRVEKLCPATCRGGSRIYLEPGEESWSDEMDLTVAAGDKIAVTVYIKNRQPVESVGAFWSGACQRVSLSHSGSYLDGSIFEDFPPQKAYRLVAESTRPVKQYLFYGVTGVQVLTEDSVKVIAMFGDSITHMSYLTNSLFKRLQERYPGETSILNCGCFGNRLLYDAVKTDALPAQGRCFAKAGVRRFEEDVFGGERVDTVCVLEGINDIMHPLKFGHPEERVDADRLVEGLRRMIAIAHGHGAKIFGATLIPCGSADYPAEWLPQFEDVRLRVNEKIREGIGFDGYFDYDAAMRDEENPGYIKAGCHTGDGVHPNENGGLRMAEAIDLEQVLGERGL